MNIEIGISEILILILVNYKKNIELIYIKTTF